jgi:hypothetical protein
VYFPYEIATSIYPEVGSDPIQVDQDRS